MFLCLLFLQEMQGTVDEEESNLQYVTSTGKELLRKEPDALWACDLRDKLHSLGNCWDRVGSVLKERLQFLRKHMLVLKRFQVNAWRRYLLSCIRADKDTCVSSYSVNIIILTDMLTFILKIQCWLEIKTKKGTRWHEHRVTSDSLFIHGNVSLSLFSSVGRDKFLM